MDCEAYRDHMLDLLYGEAGEQARQEVEGHQATCPACREEYAALKRLRRDLGGWTLPQEATPAGGGMGRAWPLLALAASLVLALGGLILAGTELRHDERGWTLRLGRPPAVENEMRVLQAAQRQQIERVQASLSVAPVKRDELLLAVRTMIAESEQRQGARLAQALGELSDRTEAQRRYDLAQVSAGLAYLEGKAGLHAARTTELMGEVLLASQQK